MSASIGEIDEGVQEGFDNYLAKSDPWTGEEIAPSPDSQDTKPKDTEADRLEEPEGEPDADPAEGEEEAPAEEGDQQPDDDAEPDADADAKPRADDDDVINTIGELAKSFEVEESEFLEHMQVQGREGEEMVSLGSVIDQYRSAPVESESARVEMEKERETLRTASETEIQSLQEATARMVGRIQNHQTPEGGWDALRASNPGEYIRLREAQQTDHDEAANAIHLMNEAGERKTKEEAADLDRTIGEQAAKTFRLRPDWLNEEVGKKAHDEIQDYMKRHGFSEEIREGLYDASSIICVWKAAQYDKAQAAKPGVRKRLSKLPRKHLAPSARNETAHNDARNKRRDAIRNKFRKSGTVEDMAAVLNME